MKVTSRFPIPFSTRPVDHALGILTAAAREVGVAILLGALSAQLMGALRAQDYVDHDHSALHLLVETLSGQRWA
jgi:2-hydroxy-3-oxopropionate reductase